MRRRYLVCYDICDQKRWSKVHKIMQGYGLRLQYSVFCCDLTEMEKIVLVGLLTDVVHHGEDRVMIVDLGRAEGNVGDGMEFVGSRLKVDGIRNPIV